MNIAHIFNLRNYQNDIYSLLTGINRPSRAFSSADGVLSHRSGSLDFVLKHYIACVPSNSPIMSHCLPLNIFIPNS